MPPSLRAHLTGVQAPLLSVPVQPLEVPEAWGTAKPGLPEAHVAGEEEVPASRPHAALQQREHAAPPAATLRSRPENLALLPVEPAHVQVDGGLLLLWGVSDVLDRASDDCRDKDTGVRGSPGHLRQGQPRVLRSGNPIKKNNSQA